MSRINIKYIFLLSVLCYFFFMFGNGLVSLTHPDEVFYTQTAKEMIQHHSWATPYLFGEPQFEKPILLYWLLRLASFIFGVSSFGARFFPALFAALGVLAVYFLSVLAFKDDKKAFFAGLVLLSSGLYIGLARSVFTDMIFSVFILFALAAFFMGYADKKREGMGVLFFFVFSALAVLTKGPLGILIPLLTVILFLFVRKELKVLRSRYYLWGTALFLLIALPWYVLMADKYGASFTREFFYNDHFRRLVEAEHTGNDTWYFYPLTMIGCLFPWSLYVAPVLIYLFLRLRKNVLPIYPFLACWISVVFVIFQVAHSKLTSYILPMFPALAIIVGDFIFDMTTHGKRNRIVRWVSMIMIVISALSVAALVFVPFKYIPYISSRLAINVLAVLFFLFTLSAIYLIRKNRLMQLNRLFVFLLPIVLLAVPFIHKDLEPYISCRDVSNYLMKNYEVKNTILCTKLLVRGIRFYTDKDVAVISLPGSPFFSPHPIPFLSNDAMVSDFLRKQKVTYCALKKSYIDDIERISGKEFKYSLLKTIGSINLVKVELVE